MSLKKLLGIHGNTISEAEIYQKIDEAKKNNLEWVEITDLDGSKIRMHIPQIIYDEQLMTGYGW